MVERLAPDEVDDALAGERPVVLEAWAPACGACYQISRLVDLAAEEFRQIDFYRLDVRDPASAEAARRLGLRVAPTVILYLGGVEQRRLEEPRGAGELWELLGAAGA